MCGLIGYSGNGFDPLKIKILFLYNENRGKDSCGVYTSKNLHIEKQIGKVSEEMLSKIKLSSSNVLIGHTRNKTIGNITIENTHPFLIKKEKYIIGAHNGTIENFSDLKRKYEDFNIKHLEIDSKLIFEYLSQNSDYNILGEITGGIAVLFSDLQDKKILYCYRNNDRPLFRGYIKNDGLYFSSIKKSLEAIECQSIKEIGKNVLYTIKNGKIVNTIRIKTNPYKHKYILPAINDNTSSFSNRKICIVGYYWKYDEDLDIYYRNNNKINTLFSDYAEVYDLRHQIDRYILNIKEFIFEETGCLYKEDYQQYKIVLHFKEMFNTLKVWYKDILKTKEKHFYHYEIDNNENDSILFISIGNTIVGEFNRTTRVGIIYKGKLTMNKEKVKTKEIGINEKLGTLEQSIISVDADNEFLDYTFIEEITNQSNIENITTLINGLTDIIVLQNEYLAIVLDKFSTDMKKTGYNVNNKEILGNLLEKGNFIRDLCSNKTMAINDILSSVSDIVTENQYYAG